MKNVKNRNRFSGIFIIAAICTFFIPSADYAGDRESLSTEYLTSGSWGPENILGMKIKFTPDGYFESEINWGQSYCAASGKFSIKGGYAEPVHGKLKNRGILRRYDNQKRNHCLRSIIAKIQELYTIQGRPG